MPFRPNPGDRINIADNTYTFTEHPAAPGMAYGQAGRRGTVYQLADEQGGLWALKVFLRQYREPRLVGQSERIRGYAALPGLRVCEREVLTASRHRDLIRDQMDLAYAVLMPWIAGRTWQEIVVGRDILQTESALASAQMLAETLVGMEERGLAHCDLSGPNLILLPGGGIELVDLEEMYAPDLVRPKALPGGSPGYAHRTAPEGLWREEADRFAGAVLIAEILGWAEEKIREQAWGEGYFQPEDMGANCERFHLLCNVLRRWDPALKDLFEAAWFSDTLAGCPTFTEWMAAQPDGKPAPAEAADSLQLPMAGVEPGLRDEPEKTGKVLEERGPDPWMCMVCGKQVDAAEEMCPYCEQGEQPAANAWAESREESDESDMVQGAAQDRAIRTVLPPWIWGLIVPVLALGLFGLVRMLSTQGAEEPGAVSPAVETLPAARDIEGFPSETPGDEVAEMVEPEASPSPLPAEPVLYTVQEGDSLWDIAESFGVDLELLLEVNNLSSDSALVPGDVLVIPPWDPAVYPDVTQAAGYQLEDNPVQYVVQEGDTLAIISVIFNVPVQELLTYNNLDNGSNLFVGQVLLVPQRATASTPMGGEAVEEQSAGSSMFSDVGGMEMVYIPSGSFIMGASENDVAAAFLMCYQYHSSCPDERFSPAAPQHGVYLDGYWIGKTEVTKEMYIAFLIEEGIGEADVEPWLDTENGLARIEYVDGSWESASGFEQSPVVKVTWYGAEAYCEWAGGRLPTEAEWEHAARGNDGRRYPWGNWQPSCSLANYHPCVGYPVQVGSYPAGASPYGVLDMAGNVEEWVLDWYDPDFYTISPGENPAGPVSGTRRGLRDSSWFFNPYPLFSFLRGSSDPVYNSTEIGFRCVIPN